LIASDADTGMRGKRLIGLNRRKAEEWCEYHVVFLFYRFAAGVIAPGPISETALMTIMHCVMDSARPRQACQGGHFRHAHHHWQSQQGIQHLATALVHVVVHGSNLPVSTVSLRSFLP
jgi:hypothetical protein